MRIVTGFSVWILDLDCFYFSSFQQVVASAVMMVVVGMGKTAGMHVAAAVWQQAGMATFEVGAVVVAVA